MSRLCAPAWLLVAVTAFAAEPPAAPCLDGSVAVGATAERVVAEQIEQARARVAAHPDQAEPKARLGMTLHAYGAFTAAAACYAAALSIEPAAPRWRYYHAVALAKLGRTEQALAEADRALDLRPDLLPAVILRAEMLALLGAMEPSAAAWRRAIELDRQSAPAHYGLGRALAVRGLEEGAVSAFERAVAIEPSAPALYALAQTYRRAGRIDDAQRAMATYQRMDRTAASPPENALLAEIAALNRSARIQVDRGALLARSGRTEQAVRDLEEALAADPDLVVAHANLIALYAGAGDLERAERHYLQAVALDPQSADAHFNWGGALAQRGRWDEAAAILEKAVAAGPHSAEARVRLGQAYEELDRREAAIEQHRLALDSDPLHREARRMLGAALVESGQLEEGLDHLEKAVDLGDGRTAAYLEGLSRAHEADGRIELALGYARRALRRAVRDGLDELVAPLEAAIARLEARR